MFANPVKTKPGKLFLLEQVKWSYIAVQVCKSFVGVFFLGGGDKGSQVRDIDTAKRLARIWRVTDD
jgi:drug/metabolite transporter (DMT)-like permease